MDYINIKLGNINYVQHTEYSKMILTTDDGTVAPIDSFKCLPTLTQEILNDGMKIQKSPNDYFILAYDSVTDTYGLKEYIGTGIKNIIIPSKIMGKDIWLSPNLFYENNDIERIYIPSEITELPDYFCQEMPNLTEVMLSPNIKKIPISCFSGCTNLERIDLKNITEIDEYAFEKCTSLTSLNLTKVDTINFAAFSGCNSLRNISLQNIISIDRNAFEYCTNLQSACFGSNLNEIEDEAFTECKRLHIVVMFNGIRKIGKKAFFGCYELKSIKFPNTIKEIGTEAFRATGLNDEIILPKNLELIRNKAFADTEIKRITMSKNTKYDNSVFPLDALLNINFYENCLKKDDIKNDFTR